MDFDFGGSPASSLLTLFAFRFVMKFGNAGAPSLTPEHWEMIPLGNVWHGTSNPLAAGLIRSQPAASARNSLATRNQVRSKRSWNFTCLGT